MAWRGGAGAESHAHPWEVHPASGVGSTMDDRSKSPTRVTVTVQVADAEGGDHTTTTTTTEHHPSPQRAAQRGSAGHPWTAGFRASTPDRRAANAQTPTSTQQQGTVPQRRVDFAAPWGMGTAASPPPTRASASPPQRPSVGAAAGVYAHPWSPDHGGGGAAAAPPPRYDRTPSAEQHPWGDADGGFSPVGTRSPATGGRGGAPLRGRSTEQLPRPPPLSPSPRRGWGQGGGEGAFAMGNSAAAPTPTSDDTGMLRGLLRKEERRAAALGRALPTCETHAEQERVNAELADADAEAHRLRVLLGDAPPVGVTGAGAWSGHATRIRDPSPPPVPSAKFDRIAMLEADCDVLGTALADKEQRLHAATAAAAAARSEGAAKDAQDAIALLSAEREEVAGRLAAAEEELGALLVEVGRPASRIKPAVGSASAPPAAAAAAAAAPTRTVPAATADQARTIADLEAALDEVARVIIPVEDAMYEAAPPPAQRGPLGVRVRNILETYDERVAAAAAAAPATTPVQQAVAPASSSAPLVESLREELRAAAAAQAVLHDKLLAKMDQVDVLLNDVVAARKAAGGGVNGATAERDIRDHDHANSRDAAELERQLANQCELNSLVREELVSLRRAVELCSDAVSPQRAATADAADAAHSRLTAEVMALNNEVETALAALAGRAPVSAAASESTLVDGIARLQRDRDAAVAAAAAAASSDETHVRNVERLSADIRTRDRDLARLQQEIEDLHTQLAATTRGSSDADTLRREHSALQRAKHDSDAAADAALARQQQEIENLHTQLAAAASSDDTHVRNVERLSADIRTRDRDLARLQQEIEDLHTQLAATTRGSSDADTLRREHSALQRAKHDSNAAADAALARLLDARSQVRHLRGVINTARRDTCAAGDASAPPTPHSSRERDTPDSAAQEVYEDVSAAAAAVRAWAAEWGGVLDGIAGLQRDLALPRGAARSSRNPVPPPLRDLADVVAAVSSDAAQLRGEKDALVAQLLEKQEDAAQAGSAKTAALEAELRAAQRTAADTAADLRTQLALAEREKAAAEGSADQLRGQLAALDDDVAARDTRLNSLQQELDAVADQREREARQAQRDIDDLTAQLQTARDRASTAAHASDELAALRREKHASDDAVMKAERELKQARWDVEDRDQRVARLERQLEAARGEADAQRGDQQQRLTQLSQQLDDAARENARLSREVAQTADDLQQRDARIAQLSAQVPQADTTAEAMRLSRELQQAKWDAEDRDRRIGQLEAQLRDVHSQSRSAVDDAASATGRRGVASAASSVGSEADRERETTRLSRELQQARLDVHDRDARLLRLEEQLGALKEDVTRDAIQARKEMDDAHHELQRVRQELEDRTLRVAELEEQLRQVEATRVSRPASSFHSAQLERSRGDLSRLSSELQQTSAEIAQARADRTATPTSLSRHSSVASDASRTVLRDDVKRIVARVNEEHAHQMAASRADRDAVAAERDRLVDENNALRAELAAGREREAADASARDALAAQRDALEQEVAVLTPQIAALEAEVQRLNAELDAYRAAEAHQEGLDTRERDSTMPAVPHSSPAGTVDPAPSPAMQVASLTLSPRTEVEYPPPLSTGPQAEASAAARRGGAPVPPRGQAAHPQLSMTVGSGSVVMLHPPSQQSAAVEQVSITQPGSPPGSPPGMVVPAPIADVPSAAGARLQPRGPQSYPQHEQQQQMPPPAAPPVAAPYSSAGGAAPVAGPGGPSSAYSTPQQNSYVPTPQTALAPAPASAVSASASAAGTPYATHPPSVVAGPTPVPSDPTAPASRGAVPAEHSPPSASTPYLAAHPDAALVVSAGQVPQYGFQQPHLSPVVMVGRPVDACDHQQQFPSVPPSGLLPIGTPREARGAGSASVDAPPSAVVEAITPPAVGASEFHSRGADEPSQWRQPLPERRTSMRSGASQPPSSAASAVITPPTQPSQAHSQASVVDPAEDANRTQSQLQMHYDPPPAHHESSTSARPADEATSSGMYLAPPPPAGQGRDAMGDTQDLSISPMVTNLHDANGSVPEDNVLRVPTEEDTRTSQETPTPTPKQRSATVGPAAPQNTPHCAPLSERERVTISEETPAVPVVQAVEDTEKDATSARDARAADDNVVAGDSADAGGSGVAYDDLAPGECVARNPAVWEWGNQDGGAGEMGTVVSCEEGWAEVTWMKTGLNNSYRWGYDGKYDLIVVPRGGAAGASNRAQQGPRRSPNRDRVGEAQRNPALGSPRHGLAEKLPPGPGRPQPLQRSTFDHDATQPQLPPPSTGKVVGDARLPPSPPRSPVAVYSKSPSRRPSMTITKTPPGRRQSLRSNSPMSDVGSKGPPSVPPGSTTLGPVFASAKSPAGTPSGTPRAGRPPQSQPPRGYPSSKSPSSRRPSAPDVSAMPSTYSHVKSPLGTPHASPATFENPRSYSSRSQSPAAGGGLSRVPSTKSPALPPGVAPLSRIASSAPKGPPSTPLSRPAGSKGKLPPSPTPSVSPSRRMTSITRPPVRTASSGRKAPPSPVAATSVPTTTKRAPSPPHSYSRGSPSRRRDEMQRPPSLVRPRSSVKSPGPGTPTRPAGSPFTTSYSKMQAGGGTPTSNGQREPWPGQ